MRHHKKYTYCVPQEGQKGIHIHIPKTAGICVNNYLKQVAPEMVLSHASANSLKIRLNSRFDGFFDKMFTFAFVRNPWDRAVSYYLFLKRHGCDVGEFKNFIFNKEPIVLMEYSIDLAFVDVLSQKWFVVDHKSGEIIVDYIARMENFDTDFDYVRDKLGLEKLGKYMKINSQFRNASDNDYTKYYDRDTQLMVERRCAWDIETFGYRFGEDT